MFRDELCERALSEVDVEVCRRGDGERRGSGLELVRHRRRRRLRWGMSRSRAGRELDRRDRNNLMVYGSPRPSSFEHSGASRCRSCVSREGVDYIVQIQYE